MLAAALASWGSIRFAAVRIRHAFAPIDKIRPTIGADERGARDSRRLPAIFRRSSESIARTAGRE
jgi:hypothetical protein